MIIRDKKSQAIKEINSLVKDNYHLWIIGITDDPRYIEEDRNYPRFWKEWKINTSDDARSIKKHFDEKGCMHCMKSMSMADINAVYVYIY